MLGKIAGPLIKVAASLAKNVLASSATMAFVSAIDGSIQKKIHGGLVRAGKRIPLAISNEDVDIIRIIKSLENSGVLTDGVSETKKQEIKRQEVGFLGMLLGTLGVSMLGNMLTGKGLRARTGYNAMDHMGKLF